MFIFLVFISLILTFVFGLAIIGFVDGFGYTAEHKGVNGDGAWIDRK